MPGTAAGAERRVAEALGLSVEELRALRERSKWCSHCKGWHDLSAFGVDLSRADGRATTCLASRRVTTRAVRTMPRGRRFVAPRDGDRLQARRRVNHLVDVGLLPDPNTVACSDCGHVGDDRRHEYDHYLGYSAEHHEHVQAVCSRCHKLRPVVV